MRRCLLAVCAMALCGCSGTHRITIGSKNFTEQVILGEMAAQQIERKLNIKVERRLNLGGTLLAHEALREGQIDLYPEYTGTAVTNVLKQKVTGDSAGLYMQVKDEYLRRFNLVWLPPLGFNDTFAMVVRAADGRTLSAPQLSAATARAWRLGVGYEFLTRPDGLANLDHTYRLKWQGTAKTMDLGLLYQALKQNQIDMAAGNSTDGLLTDQRLLVLADDKSAFPPYDACFVARESLLKDQPGVRDALTMLSGQISEASMRKLNREVDVLHRPVVAVVRDFLKVQP